MQIHQFEFAGLGKAPFRIVGLFSFPSKSLAEFNPSAYNNQMQAMPKDVSCGQCQFCHTALTHNYIVKSSDGRKFVVGSDCVKKTGDHGLVEQIKLIEREARREAKLKAMQAQAQAILNAQREKNNGLTDSELFEKKKQETLDLRMPYIEKLELMLSPFITGLKQSNGQFSADMIQKLNQCNLDLSDRTVRIIIGIAAKLAGRANSRAYNQRFQELEILWDEVKTVYQSMPKLP